MVTLELISSQKRALHLTLNLRSNQRLVIQVVLAHIITASKVIVLRKVRARLEVVVASHSVAVNEILSVVVAAHGLALRQRVKSTGLLLALSQDLSCLHQTRAKLIVLWLCDRLVVKITLVLHLACQVLILLQKHHQLLQLRHRVRSL